MDREFGAPFRIGEVKAAGDAWEVSGYVSTYGNVDYGGDVVLPGAFDASLTAGQKVRFLYGHDQTQVLGVPLQLKSDATGLYGRFKISRTRLGEDVHRLLLDGALDSFSIGYIPADVEFDGSGARLLKQVNLLEASIVAMPMNAQAAVTAVKAGTPDLKATWDAAYVNSLEDDCFAGIEPGGTKDDEGKTVPRDRRHLPHHAKGNGGDGPVDLPHLRNALARVEQMQAGGAEFVARCRAHLDRHANAEGIGDHAGGGSGGKKADPPTVATAAAVPAAADAGWTALPYGEHAAAVSAAVAAFVARTRDLTAALAAKGNEPTAAKRQQVATLLETFSGLDALRAQVAAHALTLSADRDAALRLRLELRRRKSRSPVLAPVEMAGPTTPITESPGNAPTGCVGTAGD